MTQILLSSIAKNDVRLLMRVFNAEEKGKGNQFLKDIQEFISEISTHPKTSIYQYDQVYVAKMETFPVHIHYTLEESENSILITAVFKESL